MKLIIRGKPYMQTPPNPQQTIAVRYDPTKQLTIIDCDVDIVTLGLAVNALHEQYEDYLEQLSPDIACKIRDTTRKAVRAYEKN